MFPCFISSQDRTLDWRFLPVEQCTWKIQPIPDEVRKAALRYMAAAGLVYAAVDFAIDADGAFWFLEANANGQFGFVEITTGAPISQAIADWLTNPPTTTEGRRADDSQPVSSGHGPVPARKYHPLIAKFPMSWPPRGCNWCSDDEMVWAYPVGHVTFPG